MTYSVTKLLSYIANTQVIHAVHGLWLKHMVILLYISIIFSLKNCIY